MDNILEKSKKDIQDALLTKMSISLDTQIPIHKFMMERYDLQFTKNFCGPVDFDEFNSILWYSLNLVIDGLFGKTDPLVFNDFSLVIVDNTGNNEIDNLNNLPKIELNASDHRFVGMDCHFNYFVDGFYRWICSIICDQSLELGYYDKIFQIEVLQSQIGNNDDEDLVNYKEITYDCQKTVLLAAPLLYEVKRDIANDKKLIAHAVNRLCHDSGLLVEYVKSGILNLFNIIQFDSDELRDKVNKIIELFDKRDEDLVNLDKANTLIIDVLSNDSPSDILEFRLLGLRARCYAFKGDYRECIEQIEFALGKYSLLSKDIQELLTNDRNSVKNPQDKKFSDSELMIDFPFLLRFSPFKEFLL